MHTRNTQKSQENGNVTHACDDARVILVETIVPQGDDDKARALIQMYSLTKELVKGSPLDAEGAMNQVIDIAYSRTIHYFNSARDFETC